MSMTKTTVWPDSALLSVAPSAYVGGTTSITWLPTGWSTRPSAHVGTSCSENEDGTPCVQVESKASPVFHENPVNCTVIVSVAATCAPAPRMSGWVTRSDGGSSP